MLDVETSQMLLSVRKGEQTLGLSISVIGTRWVWYKD